jgi:transposase
MLIQRHVFSMRRKSSKSDYLKSVGAWNEKARLVENELFRQSDFFDPRDKAQAKYEMIRAAFVEDLNVSEASRQFGYSRESFYNTADAFREKGIVGLADNKRGPKTPRKLTAEVQQFILDSIDRGPTLSGREIAEQIQKELQIEIHHRSVERFIAKRSKKN